MKLSEALVNPLQLYLTCFHFFSIHVASLDIGNETQKYNRATMKKISTLKVLATNDWPRRVNSRKATTEASEEPRRVMIR
jgi:hypothetical protein